MAKKMPRITNHTFLIKWTRSSSFFQTNYTLCICRCGLETDKWFAEELNLGAKVESQMHDIDSTFRKIGIYKS